jgi:hypothetical protein
VNRPTPTLARLRTALRAVREQDPEHLAEAVARRLGLSPAGPRDAVAAAAALGIAVERAALPAGVRAVWCRSGRRFRILVSRRLKPAAANFAVAHELYEIVAPARSKREAAADRFAAAFLRTR